MEKLFRLLASRLLRLGVDQGTLPVTADIFLNHFLFLHLILKVRLLSVTVDYVVVV